MYVAKQMYLQVPVAVSEEQQVTIEVHGVSPSGRNSLIGQSQLD